MQSTMPLMSISDEELQLAVENRDVRAVEEIVKHIKKIKSHAILNEENGYSSLNLDRAIKLNNKYLKYKDLDPDKSYIEYGLILKAMGQGILGVIFLACGLDHVINMQDTQEGPFVVMTGGLLLVHAVYDAVLFKTSKQPSVSSRIGESLASIKKFKTQTAKSTSGQNLTIIDI